MDEFAKLMDPKALQGFKGGMVSVVEGATEVGQEKQILRLFDGVRNADELKKLDDAQVFLRFYRGYSRLKPELRQSLAGAETQIMGHDTEGNEYNQVV